MRTHLLDLRLAALVAATGALAAFGAADPLPPASYLVEVNAGVFGGNSSIGATPRTLELDLQGAYGEYYQYDIQVNAETYGGLRPLAVSSTSVSGTRGTSGFNLQARALASIDYSVRIRQRAGAPPPPGGLGPIPVSIAYMMDLTGHASAAIGVGYSYISREILTGHYSESNTFQHVYSVGEAVGVRLRTAVTGYADSPGQGRPSESQSVADPFFEFDQATFDSWWGSNSYRLSDYYEFEYSDGVFAPVPEPATTLLGLAALAGAEVRRRRLGRGH